MRESLELDLLQTLVAIVDSGSFAAAALRIHRTQSAVSMQMRRLESIAGKPIFDRGNRKARLTPAGETLLAYARRILTLEGEAFSLLSDAELIGTLRLGWPEDCLAALRPDILVGFATEYPRATISLRCDDSAVLREQVMAGELDLALVARAPEWSDVEPIRREPLVWAASPYFVAHADFLPVALGEPGSVTRGHALQALSQAGRAHRIAQVSPHLSGLFTIVRAGLAVTATPRWSVPPDLAILGPAHGLPKMPDVEICILKAQRCSKLAIGFAHHVENRLASADCRGASERDEPLRYSAGRL
jgi:DNA-binding transcriptional LysR family regulator